MLHTSSGQVPRTLQYVLSNWFKSAKVGFCYEKTMLKVTPHVGTSRMVSYFLYWGMGLLIQVVLFTVKDPYFKSRGCLDAIGHFLKSLSHAIAETLPNCNSRFIIDWSVVSFFKALGVLPNIFFPSAWKWSDCLWLCAQNKVIQRALNIMGCG